MSSRQFALAALLLVATAQTDAGSTADTLGVSLTIVSKNTCKFDTPRSATLNFGVIDQTSTVDAPAVATLKFTCNGKAKNATFFIAADEGSHPDPLGARRMQNVTFTSEYMPYSLSLTPVTDTVPAGKQQTLTITGAVAPVHFQKAAIGAYSDTVSITVTP